MHADHLDPERARLLDEADADVVGQEEALPVGTELGVGLPGAHAPALRELVHRLDVARLVRVDPAVQQQTVRAFEPIDDAPHGVCRLDRHRFGIAPRGDEGEDHQVGVAVEEHILHELLGSEAAQMTPRTGRLAAERTGRLRRPLERVGRGIPHPRAGRIDEVPLHVEDELAVAELRGGELRLERGLGLELEETAAPAGGSVRGVESEQRARCAAGGDEEFPAREAEAARVARRRLVREAVRGEVSRRERHRDELAVRGRVELDGEPRAVRIDGWIAAMSRHLAHLREADDSSPACPRGLKPCFSTACWIIRRTGGANAMARYRIARDGKRLGPYAADHVRAG